MDETWNCVDCNRLFYGPPHNPDMTCMHCKDVLGTAICKQEIDYSGQPHGWIQWKGTQVCMDIHCKCGALMHIDAGFAYYIDCPYCHTVFACDGNIHLIELTETQAAAARNLTGAIVTPDKEDDDF